MPRKIGREARDEERVFFVKFARRPKNVERNKARGDSNKEHEGYDRQGRDEEEDQLEMSFVERVGNPKREQAIDRAADHESNRGRCWCLSVSSFMRAHVLQRFS